MLVNRAVNGASGQLGRPKFVTLPSRRRRSSSRTSLGTTSLPRRRRPTDRAFDHLLVIRLHSGEREREVPSFPERPSFAVVESGCGPTRQAFSDVLQLNWECVHQESTSAFSCGGATKSLRGMERLFEILENAILLCFIAGHVLCSRLFDFELGRFHKCRLHDHGSSVQMPISCSYHKRWKAFM